MPWYGWLIVGSVVLLGIWWVYESVQKAKAKKEQAKKGRK